MYSKSKKFFEIVKLSTIFCVLLGVSESSSLCSTGKRNSPRTPSVKALSPDFIETYPKVDLKSYNFFALNRTIQRFENGTIQIPKVFTKLVYECNSTLPTRWHSEGKLEDDYIQNVQVKKYRTYNYSEFAFRSTIQFDFRTSGVLPNITCQNVHSEEFQTRNSSHEYLWTTMEVQNPKAEYEYPKYCSKETTNCSDLFVGSVDSFFYLRIVNGKGNPDPDPSPSKIGSHPFCSISLHVDLKTGKYECKNSLSFVGGPEFEMPAFYVPCGNLDECHMFYEKEPKNHCSNGITLFDRSCTGSGCVPLQTASSPFILACGESNIYSVGRTFFPLSISHSTDPTAKSFTSDSEEDFMNDFCAPEILQMTNLSSTSSIYSGDSLTFQCIGLKSVLMHGFRWFLVYKNGSLNPLGLGDDNDELRDQNLDSITYLSKKTVAFDSGEVVAVRCDAPWWNSFKWAETTYSVHVTLSKAPTFEGQKVEGQSCSFEKDFERREDYSCAKTGLPAANITWEIDHIRSVAEDGGNCYRITENATHSNLRLISSHPRFKKVQNIQCNAVGRNSRNEEAIECHQFIIKEIDPNSLSDGEIAGIILAGLGLLIVFFTILFGLGLKYTVMKNKLRKLTDEEVLEFTQGRPMDYTSEDISGNMCFTVLPFNSNFILPPSHVIVDKSSVLGEGEYGRVYRGLLYSKEVAVKTVKPNSDIAYIKSFLNELKIMGNIGKHENIVEFLGAVTERIQEREVQAVVELSPTGSLHSYLQKFRRGEDSHIFVDLVSNNAVTPRMVRKFGLSDKERKITTIDLLKWCKQIAAGMEFLASKRVIHGDLAARNVLVFHDKVKVCDFGLSRQLYADSTYVKKQKTPLPWHWMALESLRFREFSLESDVWSFGITMWEIFSMGQVPYPGVLNWTTEFVEVLANGMRMAKPKYAPNNVYEEMHNCWNEIPIERPSFTDIVASLSRILAQVLPKPNNNNCSPPMNKTQLLASSKFGFDTHSCVAKKEVQTNEDPVIYVDIISLL